MPVLLAVSFLLKEAARSDDKRFEKSSASIREKHSPSCGTTGRPSLTTFVFISA
jgi:hypothetical protein